MYFEKTEWTHPLAFLFLGSMYYCIFEWREVGEWTGKYTRSIMYSDVIGVGGL